MNKQDIKDIWLDMEINTVRKLVKYIQDHPELEGFMDKRIVFKRDDLGQWCNNPQIRLSYCNEEVVLEGGMEFVEE